MRYISIFSILVLLIGVVHAYEDYEIFDLVSAVEGKGTTFYSWLDVSSSASVAEIGRAYRKKSMLLHPDKNPGVKGAQERFARLGVVASILRSQEGRERSPRWRGTGYYYSRFRPGLGTVVIFLTTLTTGLHYIVQHLNFKRDLARIEHIVGQAKLVAWGPKMIPSSSRRKVKVNLGGPPRLDEDGNVILGRSIDVVVESNGDVFMLESDGGQTPINATAATAPSLQSTWFLSLVTVLISRLLRWRTQPGDTTPAEASEDGETETGTGTESDLPEAEYHVQEQKDGNVKAGKVGPVSLKAGGRRRKVVRKR
ncbi:DnaJ-domain-containing protein [Lactarius indigo]|nr:DnaJ-domain-containing protein [Lactarius indigo]